MGAKKLMILFLSIIWAIGLNAQEITLSARLDTGQIYLGDQINLHYEVEMPVDFTLLVTAPADSGSYDVEFLSEVASNRTDLNNRRVKVIGSFLITSFQEGLNVVPSPAFLFSDGQRDTTIFLGEDLMIMVMRTDVTLSDSTRAIFDIIPPLKEPVTIKELLPYAGILIASLLIIFIILKYLLPLFRKGKTGGKEEEVLPPHVIAFRALTELKKSELWQNGKIKEYYSSISSIIREYLDNRYGLTCMEQTTGEIITAVSRKNLIDQTHRHKLKDMLTTSDMVKFAKLTPSEKDHIEIYDAAWNFISGTRPVDIVTENKEE